MLGGALYSLQRKMSEHWRSAIIYFILLILYNTTSSQRLSEVGRFFLFMGPVMTCSFQHQLNSLGGWVAYGYITAIQALLPSGHWTLFKRTSNHRPKTQLYRDAVLT